MKPNQPIRPRWLVPHLLLLIMVISLLLTACEEKQSKTFTIGIVNLSPTLNPTLDGFKAGMAELGYVEDENVTYIYEGPVGSIEALQPAIQKLIEAEVDLIFSISTPATLKARQAVEGTDIPVVFAPVSDPVGSGAVDNLRNPGGNLTGIRVGGYAPKALEWLLTIIPGVTRLFVLHNPDDSSSVQTLADLDGAATTLGVQLVVHEVRMPDEVTAALEVIPADVQAIFILPSGQIAPRVADIVAAATERDLPTAATSEWAEKGVLMTYGGQYFQVGEQAARLADQILKGTPPGDLPVEAAEFFLNINLQSAQAIDLNIPDEILRQAQTIIR